MSDNEQKPCPKDGRSAGCGHANPPHPCPYKEEINDDGETLCECCDECTDECRMDI